MIHSAVHSGARQKQKELTYGGSHTTAYEPVYANVRRKFVRTLAYVEN